MTTVPSGNHIVSQGTAKQKSHDRYALASHRESGGSLLTTRSLVSLDYRRLPPAVAMSAAPGRWREGFFDRNLGADVEEICEVQGYDVGRHTR